MGANHDLSFLFITANSNETDAVLKSPYANFEERRSENPKNTNYYSVGSFGKYKVVHLELQDQGSAKTDASLLSIDHTISEFHPDAVILVGIAFGKENSVDGQESKKQPIGTVLISDKVADYESGKQSDTGFESDGSVPESGRQLLSVFKHYAKEWKALDTNNRHFEIGLMLSGDKLVNDPQFKKELLTRYPRAIGGEMEGRGAYAACRYNELNEWIIIKAIADYGDGTKDVDKKARQIKASKAAVSLLEFVFSKPEAFSQFAKGKRTNTSVPKDDT